MMSYKDMTFCPHHEFCTYGIECPRSLTEEVRQDAIMWWGSDDAPISIFLDKPHCFEDNGKESV